MKLELRKNRNGESDLSMFNKENFVGAIVGYANYVEPSSGAEYRFVSEGLYNVTNDVRVRLNVGYPVNVYVEPGNFRNYYVDLGVC